MATVFGLGKNLLEGVDDILKASGESLSGKSKRS